VIDILSAAGREALANVARRKPIVALDFDGTLAPIVDEPGAARMRDTTRRLLRVLSLLCPCAVISGRARGDVASRLGSASLAAVVGNHGAETSGSPSPVAGRDRLRAWASVLRRSLDAGDVEVEDKGFTLAVHYRRSRRRDEVGKRIWALARELPGAKLTGGNAVVNILPEGAPTKGDAVTAFAASFRGRPVVFVGDDDVDEDAFRSPAVTLSIRVGHHPVSAASYYLQAQEDIDRLLRELIQAQLDADGIVEGWVEAPSKAGGGKP